MGPTGRLPTEPEIQNIPIGGPSSRKPIPDLGIDYASLERRMVSRGPAMSLRPSEMGSGGNRFRLATTNYDGHCRCEVGTCPVWVSKDGEVHICQMGDRHLVNAEGRMAGRDWDSAPEWVREQWQETWDGLKVEIERRGL